MAKLTPVVLQVQATCALEKYAGVPGYATSQLEADKATIEAMATEATSAMTMKEPDPLSFQTDDVQKACKRVLDSVKNVEGLVNTIDG